MLAFIYISGIRLNIVKGAKSNFMQIYAALLNTGVQFRNRLLCSCPVKRSADFFTYCLASHNCFKLHSVKKNSKLFLEIS